jgi:hypothetical protein
MTKMRKPKEMAEEVGEFYKSKKDLHV